MNKEGYKTPTEDAAIARETAREKLRAKYNVREGEMIRMRLKVSADEKAREGIMRVRVVEIHKHHITIERSGGCKESIIWWDFERLRID